MGTEHEGYETLKPNNPDNLQPKYFFTIPQKDVSIHREYRIFTIYSKLDYLLGIDKKWFLVSDDGCPYLHVKRKPYPYNRQILVALPGLKAFI